MGGSGEPQPIEILLVEDDAGDELMTMAAFELGSISNRVSVAHDGLEAIECLRRAPADVVLLDLVLPRQPGIAVLADIRADPDLTATVVIALTTSDREIEHWQQRGLPVDGYLTKPVDVERFLAVLIALDGFAVRVVRSP